MKNVQAIQVYIEADDDTGDAFLESVVTLAEKMTEGSHNTVLYSLTVEDDFFEGLEAAQDEESEDDAVTESD